MSVFGNDLGVYCSWKDHNTHEMAERAGFEPAIRGYRIPLFESGAFSHSATSPKVAATSVAAPDTAIQYISAPVAFR